MSDIGNQNAIRDLSVSRETLAKLRLLVDLVLKWTRHINLVSVNSINDIWERHVLDSSQLFNHLPTGAKTWIDLGSGGGFPGLVVGIIAQELSPELKVILVESDQRKAAFLRAAIRELRLDVGVLTSRIEKIEPLAADVISARALGSLSTLLGYMNRHQNATGMGLFPKGRAVTPEIAAARLNWRFDLTAHASMTDPSAQILQIENVFHV